MTICLRKQRRESLTQIFSAKSCPEFRSIASFASPCAEFLPPSSSFHGAHTSCPQDKAVGLSRGRGSWLAFDESPYGGRATTSGSSGFPERCGWVLREAYLHWSTPWLCHPKIQRARSAGSELEEIKEIELKSGINEVGLKIWVLGNYMARTMSILSVVDCSHQQSGLQSVRLWLWLQASSTQRLQYNNIFQWHTIPRHL